MAAPGISSFGDGVHNFGEVNLSVSGGGFGSDPFRGTLRMCSNDDGTGIVDILPVTGWLDTELTGVSIPASPANSPGIVYLQVEDSGLNRSPTFAFTLVDPGPPGGGASPYQTCMRRRRR